MFLRSSMFDGMGETGMTPSEQTFSHRRCVDSGSKSFNVTYLSLASWNDTVSLFLSISRPRLVKSSISPRTMIDKSVIWFVNVVMEFQQWNRRCAYATPVNHYEGCERFWVVQVLRWISRFLLSASSASDPSAMTAVLASWTDGENCASMNSVHHRTWSLCPIEALCCP
jgi:hypothetical protein